MLALTKDGKIDTAIDNLVEHVLAIDDTLKPTTALQVAEAIEVYFGVKLSADIIQASTDRLLAKGHILQDASYRILILAPEFKVRVQERISEAHDLEQKVREEWLGSIEGWNNEALADCGEQLWSCLRNYMAKAFKRHGIETVHLLNPIVELSDADTKQLSIYLKEAISETCDNIYHDFASEAVKSFFLSSTPSRTKYIAQLLDATFTFFALSVDEATAAYLNEAMPKLSLFLDTNFIFGMLGLSSHPLVDVSRELIEIIQSYKLPFKLYYHEETLAELKRTLDYFGDRIRGTRWSQEASRAAIRNGKFSDIELRYHSLNAQTLTDPDAFLSKFDHIEELLAEYCFKIYRSSRSSKELDAERFQFVAEYKEYIESRRAPKTYATLNHDIEVWQSVRPLRKRGVSPIDVGAFFLTIDYYFYAFDRQVLSNKGTVGTALLPNQLLQLIRPFVPASDNFDQHFIETFAIPEFRISSSDYSATYTKVLSYLNTYADLKEDTAVQILAKEMLIQRLNNSDANMEEVKAVVDNALIENNERLIEEKEMLEEEVQKARKEIESRNVVVEQSKEQLEDIQESHRQITLQLETERLEREKSREELLNIKNEEVERQKAKSIREEKIKDLETELAASKEREKQRNERNRVAAAIIVAAMGVLVIIYLPEKLHWEWFVAHSHKSSMTGLGILTMVLLGLVIAVPEKMKYLIWGIMGAAIIALIQAFDGKTA